MTLPLPEDALERKKHPMFTGLIKYFPNALAAIAHESWKGNQQHHPDKPLHWDKSKSPDHLDCAVRHLTDYAAGGNATELAKVGWRILAELETIYEEEQA